MVYIEFPGYSLLTEHPLPSALLPPFSFTSKFPILFDPQSFSITVKLVKYGFLSHLLYAKTKENKKTKL